MASGKLRKQDTCDYDSIYPRHYIAYKTTGLGPTSLDANLDKKAWADVQSTEEFVDISTDVTPMFKTHAKIRWDDNFLYIAATMQDNHVWANQLEDQSVIFHDNDIEVFVDPAGSNHYYKEFELNAANAKWSLCLNKPYDDNGYENSSRVYDEEGWEMQALTAVKRFPDVINEPSRMSYLWVAEMALPLADLMYNNTREPPQHGSYWRVGFSRVEWNVQVDNSSNSFVKAPACQSCAKPGSKMEDNWVWSPQHEASMHLPERWGIVQFSTQEPGQTQMVKDPRWPSQAAAMAVYYAQKAYADVNNGVYTDNFKLLLDFSKPPFVLCQEVPPSSIVVTRFPDGTYKFKATLHSPDGSPWVATIDDQRYLDVAMRSTVLMG